MAQYTNTNSVSHLHLWQQIGMVELGAYHNCTQLIFNDLIARPRLKRCNNDIFFCRMQMMHGEVV